MTAHLGRRYSVVSYRGAVNGIIKRQSTFAEPDKTNNDNKLRLYVDMTGSNCTTVVCYNVIDVQDSVLYPVKFNGSKQKFERKLLIFITFMFYRE